MGYDGQEWDIHHDIGLIVRGHASEEACRMASGTLG